MIKSISDRQLEIIEAAGKILTASGLSGLTIKNLAKEMKFSESAIYRHFASKEDIIISLLEYLAQDMENRFSRVITDEQSPEENFKAIFPGIVANHFQGICAQFDKCGYHCPDSVGGSIWKRMVGIALIKCSRFGMMGELPKSRR